MLYRFLRALQQNRAQSRLLYLLILALPLLPRKCCSVTLKSECVLPCKFRRPEEQSILRHVGCSVYREHRCRNKCFVQSKQSHRRKRNREPSRIPKRKLVRLYCQSKKRKHLKFFLNKRFQGLQELHSASARKVRLKLFLPTTLRVFESLRFEGTGRFVSFTADEIVLQSLIFSPVVSAASYKLSQQQQFKNPSTFL